MENILITLMSDLCQAMKNEKSPCYRKGSCDGHCAKFYVALEALKNHKSDND